MTDKYLAPRTDDPGCVPKGGDSIREKRRKIITLCLAALFFLLALCVIAVQQWLNLTFMGVIIVNTAIGIIQEIRSKKTLDKLNILASPKAVVVRDGRRVTVDTAQLVRDDIVVFAAGNQIYADAVVAQDSCYVNEALITGESD